MEAQKELNQLRNELEACRTDNNNTRIMDAVQTLNKIEYIISTQPNNSDKEFTTQNHFYNQPNNSGEEQKLFVEMKIWDGSSYLMARCPDEDEQMSITVKDRYKSIFSLSLEQAKDLAEYLLEHVDNATNKSRK